MKSLFSNGLSQNQPLATSLLSKAVSGSKLANAYLLTGSNHENKRELAIELACILNCLNSISTVGDTTDCCIAVHQSETVKYCQNCRLIVQERHPQAYLELLPLNPDNPISKIPVEKARELAFELSKTSPFFRIIWLGEAKQDVFHRPAANSLLKTIEEPKNRCLFLLAARSKELVLPTIVSRSQEIPFIQAQFSLILGNRKLSEKDPSFESWLKLPFFQWTKGGGHTNSREEALEVSNLLLNQISRTTSKDQEEASGEGNFLDKIDRLVLLELAIIGSSALEDPSFSRYFMNLIALVQSLRTRLGRHVSQKASLDNFFIEWLNLRAQVSGNLP